MERNFYGQDRTDEGVFKTISCETAAQKDKRDGKGTKKYVSSDGGGSFSKSTSIPKERFRLEAILHGFVSSSVWTSE